MGFLPTLLMEWKVRAILIDLRKAGADVGNGRDAL
jgi:hypothetical protein